MKIDFMSNFFLKQPLQISSLVASSCPHPLLKASSPCRAQHGLAEGILCAANQMKHLMGSSQLPPHKTKEFRILTHAWVITH